MREKCSRVMLSRDASTPLLVASATSTGVRGSPLLGVVPEQVADHALRAAAQRVGLEVVHQAMQAQREPAEHLAGEARVALQFGEDARLADREQQGVGQGLGEDHVGLLEEHHRFAEARPGPRISTTFSAPSAAPERELHLAVDDHVEARAGLAAAEQDRARGRAHLRRARGNAVELGVGQLTEERDVLQELLDADRRGGHAGMLGSAGRSDP